MTEAICFICIESFQDHAGGKWQNLVEIFWMNIFREAFKIFDRNHDGTITLNEFKKVTDILGTILSQEEVDEFMKEADKVYYDDLFNSSFDVYI